MQCYIFICMADDITSAPTLIRVSLSFLLIYRLVLGTVWSDRSKVRFSKKLAAIEQIPHNWPQPSGSPDSCEYSPSLSVSSLSHLLPKKRQKWVLRKIIYGFQANKTISNNMAASKFFKITLQFRFLYNSIFDM